MTYLFFYKTKIVISRWIEETRFYFSIETLSPPSGIYCQYQPSAPFTFFILYLMSIRDRRTNILSNLPIKLMLVNADISKKERRCRAKQCARCKPRTLRVVAATLFLGSLCLFICGVVWMGIWVYECDAKHNGHIKKT